MGKDEGSGLDMVVEYEEALICCETGKIWGRVMTSSYANLSCCCTYLRYSVITFDFLRPISSQDSANITDSLQAQIRSRYKYGVVAVLWLRHTWRKMVLRLLPVFNRHVRNTTTMLRCTGRLDGECPELRTPLF